MATVTATAMAPAAARQISKQQPWDYSLRKYLLLLASVVATVTYTAGFTPPGGVWQETVEGHLDSDPIKDHRAGDPIIREVRYIRYLVFLYCNASAFASSLLVVVFILLLGVLHEETTFWIRFVPLRVVMVLDLISLIMAYAAGTCRDTFTKVYSCSLLVASLVAYLVLQAVLPRDVSDDIRSKPRKGRSRKILLLLAMFAVSLTYSAGLNTPGGFWDNNEDGHRPGDAVLKEHHQTRLTAFFVCNTTAFVASLLIILLLLDKKLHRTGPASLVLYGCIVVALVGLVGAYATGSCRATSTTTYVLSLVAAVLLCILLLLAIIKWFESSCCSRPDSASRSFKRLNTREKQLNDMVDKSRSLVLLLATLAATITYQAGLHPPGGVWQKNEKGHMAGDPILLTTNLRRYKAFFYCNSVAFVASLVVIVLVQNKLLLRHHALEAAMVLDLFGLIGAYAAGACRDASTSIYVVAMAGIVLVYVVVHVVFFTLENRERDEQVEKRRKRLLLFAILAATITYQAGLTPPSGFLLQDNESTGHHAGDPILLSNSARRFTVFFYCNSACFMLSMDLIILLVNPNMYKPAIRSYALSVCTAVAMFGLVGAYAVGSTQRRSTSISIIVMASVVLLVMALLLLVSLVKGPINGKINTDNAATTATAAAAGGELSSRHERQGEETLVVVQDDDNVKQDEKKRHAKRKYLMLLGILVASVTYQVGLDQPGGVWQSTITGEHDAGNPVMRDNRGRRYHVFYYCNSIAFVASIVVITLLLPRVNRLLLVKETKAEEWWFRLMSTTVLLDLLALLGAYAVGSSRDRKTSAYVTMLIVAVLAYVVVHVVLARWCSPPVSSSSSPPEQTQKQQGNINAGEISA